MKFRLKMLPSVIMAYLKAFGALYSVYWAYFTNKCWKIVDFWKTHEYWHKKYHIKACKNTEMNYGSYFCLFIVSYDSLFSNESFL